MIEGAEKQGERGDSTHSGISRREALMLGAVAAATAVLGASFSTAATAAGSVIDAQVAQLIIEYNPEPPFHAGHPRTAPREVLDRVEKRLPGASKELFHIV